MGKECKMKKLKEIILQKGAFDIFEYNHNKVIAADDHDYFIDITKKSIVFTLLS